MLSIQLRTKKSMSAYVYHPWRGATSLQRLAFLKYYNVQERQSKLTLGPNVAENTSDFKKLFKIKVVNHSILYQKVNGRICLSPWGRKL